MKVCFPVQNNDGVQSMVFDHFGSAPMFLIVDTETRTLAVINNRDQHHAHGSCNPLKALDQQTVDAVIVGGIGGGALRKAIPRPTANRIGKPKTQKTAPGSR